MMESELLSIRIFLVKVTLKIGKERYLFLTLFCKPILRRIKDLKHIKDLNGEK